MRAVLIRCILVQGLGPSTVRILATQYHQACTGSSLQGWTCLQLAHVTGTEERTAGRMTWAKSGNTRTQHAVLVSLRQPRIILSTQPLQPQLMVWAMPGAVPNLHTSFLTMFPWNTLLELKLQQEEPLTGFQPLSWPH